jgi:hypothetical protein
VYDIGTTARLTVNIQVPPKSRKTASSVPLSSDNGVAVLVAAMRRAVENLKGKTDDL